MGFSLGYLNAAVWSRLARSKHLTYLQPFSTAEKRLSAYVDENELSFFVRTL